MPRNDLGAKRDADNAYVRERSFHGRDIARDYPGPGDLVARAACERDLKRFYETYFPNAFSLGWSEDHLKVISRLESVVLDGGLFALAMPRAGGKTTLSVRAAIWALLYGHRRFVCLVGATQDHAKNLLKHFKGELTFNEKLVADFRQVCYPLVKLENNGRRVAGQLFRGQQTRIEWAVDRLTFPTMPDADCDGPNVGGSTVTVAGLTGAIRGQSSTLSTGVIIRPELVILDDPQTRESAGSPRQSRDRTAIINGDVLGMAGPGRKIAAVMPCTVIKADDLASEFLDRKKCPEWVGQRSKMMLSFPVNEALWEQYKAIRDEDFEAERGPDRGNAFYAERQEAMDAGAAVAWPERMEPGDISGIQHAMNLKLRDPRAFFAEYQNDPLPDEEVNADLLTPEEIAAKFNRRPRGRVPISASRLTAMIDVHGSAHYYSVVAWEGDFTGYVVDYGVFPDQKRPYFGHSDIRYRLDSAFKGMGTEGQIYAGLDKLADLILAREWQKEGGATLRVERCLVDANWGQQTDLVYKFCRESVHAAVLTPSRGMGIGASKAPMRLWAKKPGDRVGFNWRMPVDTGKRALSRVEFDANFWKSFVHNRLAVAMGDKGCLSLFGDRSEAHRMYADHLTAEHPIAVTAKGSSRTVDEWRLKVGRDNHYLDTLVGACVAASMAGVELAESKAPSPPNRPKRISFAELQKQRRA
jgi:hypothetical protein